MKKLLLSFFIFTIALFPQSTPGLDSIFNNYVALRSGLLPDGQPGTIKQKCGLPSLSPLVLHFNSLKPDQQATLKSLTARPVKDTSVVSPKKRFRIHFDKSGFEKPDYSPDSFAVALDSAWEYEVNFLKYAAPPSDGDLGGDSLYDVYIVAFQYWYGETVPENPVTPFSDTYTSYIRIDNDFSGFYTTGLPAAKVTAAHEFHHAIQMGSYILRYADTFFHELTSTSMEEFVFPEINDYLGYLSEYFDEPWLSLSKYSGYNLATWNLMLRDRFGVEIIRRQWELMPRQRAMRAIYNTLSQEGSSAVNEFNTFGIWNYFTNYRAVPGSYFKDADKFPAIRNTMKSGLMGNSAIVSVVSHPVANNQLTISNTQPGFNDTIVTIVTDFSVEEWESSPEKWLNYRYEFFTYNADGSSPLAGSYHDKFTGNTSWRYATSVIINSILVKRGEISGSDDDFPRPSPFVYGKTAEDVIYFPFKFLKDLTALLNIYDISGNLVYDGSEVPHGVLRDRIKWRVRDNSGGRLNSGVYIFHIKSESDQKTGKITVIN